MNNLDIIKKIYKPYKYIYKGKAIIIETTNGNYVLKECTNNYNELYNYLKSRSFDNLPRLVENNRGNLNVFEYIEDINNPIEQKASDLIKLVSSLHNKTTYYKDITEDNYKILYEDILNNINYYKKYYNNKYDEFYNEIMPSPSHYLFLRNYYKIDTCLDFCYNELNKWYDMVKENNRVKVSLIHNNLSLDHFIKSDKDYLISWDKSKVDSPILDLVNLYHNEYFDLNFKSLIDTYTKNFHLSDSELKLFFIMISIPIEIIFLNDEITTCQSIRNTLDYIYKTEELIRPYYTKE